MIRLIAMLFVSGTPCFEEFELLQGLYRRVERAPYRLELYLMDPRARTVEVRLLEDDRTVFQKTWKVAGELKHNLNGKDVRISIRKKGPPQKRPSSSRRRK